MQWFNTSEIADSDSNCRSILQLLLSKSQFTGTSPFAFYRAPRILLLIISLFQPPTFYLFEKPNDTSRCYFDVNLKKCYDKYAVCIWMENAASWRIVRGIMPLPQKMALIPKELHKFVETRAEARFTDEDLFQNCVFHERLPPQDLPIPMLLN